MTFLEITANKLPMDLLLEADPLESSITSYLPNSWCFIAKDENDKIVGACVLKEIEKDSVELFNIAIYPEFQAKGIGSGLLRHVINQAKSKRIKRIELGTGTFGYQLAFYQKLGFRVDSLLKDHFIHHYPEPIFENGIQHKDMLRLHLNLTDKQ